MAKMTVKNLTKSFGIDTVFRDVSFFVEPSDKIGLIGSNGAGKTTLMRCMIGELEPDSGTVARPGDLRIGYLRQNVHIKSDESLYEECKKGYRRAFEIERTLRELEKQMETAAKDPAELEAVMERYNRLTERFEEEGGLSYRSEIRGILKGMGFGEERFDQPVNSLSGGEKSRLELATMLCGRPDILFLDEPTNHLDAQAVDYLEGFLKDFRGAVFLISHDRYFLDRVVNRVFLLEHNTLDIYDCGYREYAERRRKDLEIRRRAYDNQQKEIERQKEIIDRLSRLGGSKRKRGIAQSRSRQKLLDKMVLVEAPPSEEEHMKLRFTPKYESGEDVLDIQGLAKSYGDRVLFQGLNLHLTKGEKVALIGPNGAGKTTLFRIILNDEAADAGRIAFGSAVKTAWFDQQQESLDDEKTVLDEIWDRYPQLTHYRVRSYLAKFQFAGDDIFRLVGELSGGEKARLSLLKLMIGSANFLLLDEPTNHLDIESREILEEALNDYDGTCLVISHDRYFINNVCTRVVELSENGLKSTIGGYDDYLAEKAKEAGDAEEYAGETKTARKKEEKKKRMAQQELRKLKSDVRELGTNIERLEAEIQKRNLEAADPSLYDDYERAAEHHRETEELQDRLDRMTEEWFELQTRLEEEES